MKKAIVKRHFISLSDFIKIMEDCYFDFVDCFNDGCLSDFDETDYDEKITHKLYFVTENSCTKIKVVAMCDRYMRLSYLDYYIESKITNTENIQMHIKGMESVFEFLQATDLESLTLSFM